MVYCRELPYTRNTASCTVDPGNYYAVSIEDIEAARGRVVSKRVSSEGGERAMQKIIRSGIKAMRGRDDEDGTAGSYRRLDGRDNVAL